MFTSKVHIVKRGDTFYAIARKNGIRYWPNLYFATENNALRIKRFNPNQIYPGDVIVIPTLSSILPMEMRPKIIYRNIPLFTQSIDTCWRATGKMLYISKNPGANAEANFDRVIGDIYKNMTIGLQETGWFNFYCSRLGMKEALIKSEGDLHYIIAKHGPAIVAVGEGSFFHSMVMAGYDLFSGKWLFLNPSSGEQLHFSDDEIVVGRSASSTSTSTKREATLTKYQTGPATWQNMHKWLWIFNTNYHPKVYYYER